MLNEPSRLHKITISSLFLLILLCLSKSNSSWAAQLEHKETDPLSKVDNHAQERWRRLLFYAPSLWNNSGLGLVDTPNFYLAADGKKNPNSELKATIAAMNSSPASMGDEHPACLFPARRKWLETYLPHAISIPKIILCQAFNQWLKLHQYRAVSLVFSSFYANNPSSLFGHTFIRLHKKPAQGLAAAALLDHAVNFAANPDTDNAVLYTIKGLAGGFNGTFSLMPYYNKVQEYNNAESRDLWEYELNFSQDEVDWLSRSLWDIGPHAIDYFYFDENCSAIMLHWLAIANPNLRLGQNLNFWVIPLDTVRDIRQEPNLIKQISKRPSSLSRFLNHWQLLSSSQQRQVERLLAADENALDAELKNLFLLANQDLAKVIDTSLEAVDYLDALHSQKRSQKFDVLRSKLLLRRAEMGPVNVSPPPNDESFPDLSHPSNRLSLALGLRQQVPFTAFKWRPALHDWLDPSENFSQGLAIGFFNLDLRTYRNKSDLSFVVEQFKLLEIEANTVHLPHLARKLSWHLLLDSSVWRTKDPAEEPKHLFHSHVQHFEFGLGQSLALTSNMSLDAQIIAGVQSQQPERISGVSFEFGGRASIFLHIARHNLIFHIKQLRYLVARDRPYDLLQGNLSYSYSTSRFRSIRLNTSAKSKHAEASVEWLWYF